MKASSSAPMLCVTVRLNLRTWAIRPGSIP
jgi:hypothetical protein